MINSTAAGRYTPVSIFRRHPKIDDRAVFRLVYGFSQGAGIAAIAASLGLSRKTVRAACLDLRPRLTKPEFLRWHRLNRALAHDLTREADALIREAFVDVLAECANNETCGRVFRRGNRTTRLCRSCPLPAKFTGPECAEEAAGLIDDVRSFYTRLGLREPGPLTPRRFRERLIHTCVIVSVRENTKRLPNGLLDPADHDYLAIGPLMLLLLDDLAADHDAS